MQSLGIFSRYLGCRVCFRRAGNTHIQDLTYTEANVADGFAAEALFQFSQDFGLGDLFELVVQCGLEDSDVDDSVAQCDRR